MLEILLILGRISAWLLVGGFFLPFTMLAVKVANERSRERLLSTKPLNLVKAILFWPISLSFSIAIFWLWGWDELKEYK